MTDPSENTQIIWAPRLRKDEKIMWQGWPSPRIHMRRGDIWSIAIGILVIPILVVMAFIFLSMLKQAESNGFLVFILVGLVFAVFIAAILHASLFHFILPPSGGAEPIMPSPTSGLWR